MTEIRWRVWYADGSSFGDVDGEPHEAPAWGVLVIVQEDPDAGRYNQCMDDYYLWLSGEERWRGADFVGLLDYLAHHEGPCVVRFGRTVPNARFQEVLRMAEDDPSFPARSARHRGEIVP